MGRASWVWICFSTCHFPSSTPLFPKVCCSCLTVPKILWFMLHQFQFSLLARCLGKWHELARLQSQHWYPNIFTFHAHSLEECLSHCLLKLYGYVVLPFNFVWFEDQIGARGQWALLPSPLAASGIPMGQHFLYALVWGRPIH